MKINIGNKEIQAIKTMGLALKQMLKILDRMEKSIDAIETRNWKSVSRHIRKRAKFNSSMKPELEENHAAYLKLRVK